MHELCIVRTHCHAAVVNARRWYEPANPGTSVWYTATHGMPSIRAETAPAPPRTNGLARCTTSGAKSRMLRVTAGTGTPIGRELIIGTATAGTRTTGKPAYSSTCSAPSRAAGATTIAS